jgi:hypothetical protein
MHLLASTFNTLQGSEPSEHSSVRMLIFECRSQWRWGAGDLKVIEDKWKVGFRPSWSHSAYILSHQLGDSNPVANLGSQANSVKLLNLRSINAVASIPHCPVAPFKYESHPIAETLSTITLRSDTQTYMALMSMRSSDVHAPPNRDSSARPWTSSTYLTSTLLLSRRINNVLTLRTSRPITVPSITCQKADLASPRRAK